MKCKDYELIFVEIYQVPAKFKQAQWDFSGASGGRVSGRMNEKKIFARESKIDKTIPKWMLKFFGFQKTNEDKFLMDLKHK